MALSSLTPHTAEQYRALNITSFSNPPSSSTIGNPDNNVGVQLGGWVGTDVLAFTISEAASTDFSLAVDTINANTLDINVTSDSDPTAEITYWTVNMGSNAKSSDWQISFLVEANSTNTGTWKFVKGKGEDIDKKY